MYSILKVLLITGVIPWCISDCVVILKEYKYRGCYDLLPKSSLLNEFVEKYNNSLTPDTCSKLCAKKNFSFSGVIKNECHCGNHVPSDIIKRSNEECNTPCSVNNTLICAENNKVSVYDTDVQIANFITTRSYIGCYKDTNPEYRVLKGSWNKFSTDNSPNKCHHHCYKSGFRYFGLTYGEECFCGDTIPSESTALSESECNSRCNGDSAEFCGGGWRLSIYSTGITNIPETGRFIGCFKNFKNLEVKQEFQIDLSMSNSNRRCLNICNALGYKFSGTQNRAECICTNYLPHRAFLDEIANCDKNECPGDLTDKCGGPNRIKVYQTRHSDGPSKSPYNLGCFEDKTDYHLIDGPKIIVDDETLTPKLCINICKAKGYLFAGLEAGNECFCGYNGPPPLQRVDNSDCAIPCSGNNNEFCGGLLRIMVYDTGLTHYQDIYSSWYVGCFDDHVPSDRLLKGSWHQFENNSPDVCHRHCWKTGYPSFGLTWIKECFCGDENPSDSLLVSDSECNKECGGDSNKKCGGGWKLSVYKTGLPDVFDKHEYVGCYHNDGTVLTDYKIALTLNNSPTRCFNICDQLGFLYAGLEQRTDCICGYKQPTTLFTEEDNCNTKCPGNADETCGAQNYVRVFRTTVSDDRKPSIEQKILPSKSTLSYTTKNGNPTHRYDTIFDENFSTINYSTWKHTIKMSTEPDYEFVTYASSPKTTYVKNGILYIKPSIQPESYVRGKETLVNCTGKPKTEECTRNASFNYILPPITSGQISTRNSFSFRYGRFEIRAKLPLGDWIVPQIWLTPKDPLYGTKYESGQIRIAMTRGNTDIKCDEINYGNQVLENGIIVGPPNAIRKLMGKNESVEGWSREFHSYSIQWEPDNMLFFIDGKFAFDLLRGPSDTVVNTAKLPENTKYLWKDGSKLAPFDKEFYITLGVSVGGIKDFPDTCVNKGVQKPWSNIGTKAMYNFYNSRNDWSPTWNGEDSALQVDHIKIASL